MVSMLDDEANDSSGPRFFGAWRDLFGQRADAEITSVIEKDAENAVKEAMKDPKYERRVLRYAMNRQNNYLSNWATKKAGELLASQGYTSLSKDAVFGPFMKAAHKAALEAMTSPKNPDQISLAVARAGLFALGRGGPDVPIPGKRRLTSALAARTQRERLAEIVVTEALQLMATQYSVGIVNELQRDMDTAALADAAKLAEEAAKQAELEEEEGSRAVAKKIAAEATAAVAEAMKAAAEEAAEKASQGVEEFVTTLLTRETSEEAFAFLDADGSGVISEDDVEIALEVAMPDLDETARTMYAGVILDYLLEPQLKPEGDRMLGVDREEFEAFWDAKKASAEKAATDDECLQGVERIMGLFLGRNTVEEAFQDLDEGSQDGLIDLADLLRDLEVEEPDMAPDTREAYARAVFEAMDVDGDGQVSQEEFREWWEQQKPAPPQPPGTTAEEVAEAQMQPPPPTVEDVAEAPVGALAVVDEEILLTQLGFPSGENATTDEVAVQSKWRQKFDRLWYMWAAASIQIKTLRGAYARAALVCGAMIGLNTVRASAAMPAGMCNLVASWTATDVLSQTFA